MSEGYALADGGDGDVFVNLKIYLQCRFLSYLADNLKIIRTTFLHEPVSMKTQERQCTHSKNRMTGILNSLIQKRGLNPSLVPISLSSPSRTKSRAGKREDCVEKLDLPRDTPCIGFPYVEKNEGGIEREEQSVKCMVKELDTATLRDVSMQVWNEEEALMSETHNSGATSRNGATAYLNSQWDDRPEREVEDRSFEVTDLFSEIEVRSELIDLDVQEHDDPPSIYQSMGGDETVREENFGSRSEGGRTRFVTIGPEHTVDHSGNLVVETNINKERKDAVKGGWTLFYCFTKPVSGDSILGSESEDGRMKFMKIKPKHGIGDPILETNITKEKKDETSLSKPDQDIDKWDMFPENVQYMVLSYLPAKDLFRARLVCKKFHNLLRPSSRRELFEETRANLVHTEGVYSPLYFTTDDAGWHWGGLDVAQKKWSTLPSLERLLSTPDPELLKDFLVAGGGGLLCVNVEKSPQDEKLIICNPMKQQRRVLPALNCRRHPVLMHLLVDKVQNSYKVIVAGSSTCGTEDRALKTEVYDSRTGEWTLTGNLPLPEFGLNEYQNGAYYKDEMGKEWLFCVAVLEEGGKGVIAYDIEEGEWLPNWKLRIPSVNCQAYFASTQILECSGQVYLFSEQESGSDVWFCIHRLKVYASMSRGAWEKLMITRRKGSRGLSLYPEFTCVPSDKDELCIFNTVEHTMETYNVDMMSQLPVVQTAPVLRGKSFHSLNPLEFKFEPNFRAKV